VPTRILVIRFSSIGDIVLASPVLRSLRSAFPEAEIHVATKAAYASLLEFNPNVDTVTALEADGWADFISRLKTRHYEHVVDLHNNLRSRRLTWAISCTNVRRFPKRNLRKWLLTTFKIDRMPDEHIVERYARAMPAGTRLDEKGLAFYAGTEHTRRADAIFADWAHPKPLGIVLGATYATKRWLPEHFEALLSGYTGPVILFGGPAEAPLAAHCASVAAGPVLNAVAMALPINTTAALMRHCGHVLTHDTGLMHIAAAYGIPMTVLWGNTVPAFGMAPYAATAVNLEVPDLPCRPCSKLGSDRCPQGHFRCMRDLTPKLVRTYLPPHR
jgi:ADP-heptose:LPS heptosyltransferase